MTIFYYDVSHYQGAYVPVGFTVAKATEGSDYIDPAYAGIRDRTISKGYGFAAYHYLRTTDTDLQAQHCLSVVGTTIPLMVDVEANSGNVANVASFVDAYRRRGGIVNVIYLPKWYWQGLGSPSLAPLAGRGLKLVSSNYTTYSDSGPGWAPYGGMTPSIWQFTSTPLDRNAFKGTLDELEALYLGGNVALTQADADLVAGAVWGSKPWNATDPGSAAIALQRIYNTLSGLTTTAIANAVVAALPAPQTGGITEQDVKDAVVAVLKSVIA